MRSFIRTAALCSALLALVVVPGKASAEDCYDVVLVPGSTTQSGATTCSVTSGGFLLGVPTPWGPVGLKWNPTTVSTSCALSITFIPTTHTLIPGDNLVDRESVDGWVKTYSGCHAASGAAVCDYTTTPTQHDDWVVTGLCDGHPPEP